MLFASLTAEGEQQCTRCIILLCKCFYLFSKLQVTRSLFVSTGEQVGRHLLLTALRADCREADCCYTGSQEPQENGRRGTFW